MNSARTPRSVTCCDHATQENVTETCGENYRLDCASTCRFRGMKLCPALCTSDRFDCDPADLNKYFQNPNNAEEDEVDGGDIDGVEGGQVGEVGGGDEEKEGDPCLGPDGRPSCKGCPVSDCRICCQNTKCSMEKASKCRLDAEALSG